VPSKKRKYNLKRVRRNYTYSVDEIAELFGIAEMTVFRWIAEEGLARIPGSNKYFVHGSQLVVFLAHKNGKNKKPCQAGEIYCCKCRDPRQPDLKSLTVKKIPNGTVRVSGQCGVCCTPINKVVSGQKWGPSHPLYPNINADLARHSGGYDQQRKCKDERDGQLCLNLTP
jgi:hypothetical protein